MAEVRVHGDRSELEGEAGGPAEEGPQK